MSIDLGPRTAAFRDEVRQWLDANADDEARSLREERRPSPEQAAAHKRWGDRLLEAKLICVAWPEEFGGRGLTGIELAVLNEEFARAGVPRVTRGMGESLVGPSIIAHGTDEQKATFLPRIISGDDTYCQGFSEPNAGSDLASLRTRGVVENDEVIVNGQKVWTSGYWAANMMFCLCRTDPDAPPHRGISYVLIPIKVDGRPNGVEFRPIKQITGQAHFAETFLTDARAPLFNVIGGLGNGWRVAMTTLGNERGGNATTQYVAFEREFWSLVELARETGQIDDPRVRDQLAWAYSHVELMRCQGERLLRALAAGKTPSGAMGGSVNKVFWSEYQRRLGEIAMNLQGAASLLVGPDYKLNRWQSTFLTTRSHTIWGGTAEIQRNIISERILGMPREPVRK
ncbi:MAG TPA: acyl-CoA dehydrogenase family protein [Mycobacteriales bacterium]|nr:acyl-CoA dehydrogenase family protein [Mycobacteriales bacterium]